MLRRLYPRSAYDVMAALALFLVVTGGTAFAVVAANQVNSQSIVNGQVKNVDLAANAVRTRKIQDGQVLSADVANNTLTGGDINESTLLGVNAAAVGGVTESRIKLAVAPGTDATREFTGPGFRTTLTCTHIGTSGYRVEAVPTSPDDYYHNELIAMVASPSSREASSQSSGATAEGTVILVGSAYGAPRAGQLFVRGGGKLTTIDYVGYVTDQPQACVFSGHMRVSPL